MCPRTTLLRVLLCTSLIPMTLQNVLSIVQGEVRGILQDRYVSYIGIPYASVVPGNVGRFKRADIAPVWNNIRESREPHCTSTSAVEDCLQLDVHVPASGYEMPSLVWVKGGSGNYHPGKLVARGIIVVIVRHRLGPLGFLCSKDEKVAGNTGIKDLLLALRWVSDNIIAFRGNPHRVILGGQGFGAAMVETLMLAPSADGLYHGVILQSGSVLCPWTFNYDAEDRASALRKMLNSSEDMEPSIINTDTMTLGTKSEKIDLPYMPFGICVEKSLKRGENIILESPFTMLLKERMRAVPILMGFNTNEAYIFASKLKEAKVTTKMSRDMTFLIPEELQHLSKGELDRVTKQIKDMYFDDNMNMSAVLSYHRDVYFLSHIHRSLRLHATTRQPVYYYQFSYSGKLGVIPEPGLKKNGPAHSDELGYLFPPNGRDLQDEDGVVQQHLVQLWSNFVKHLNPTPPGSNLIQWEPTDPHQSLRPRVLDINTELEMKEFPHTQAAQMWEAIYEKYYYSRNPNLIENPETPLQILLYVITWPHGSPEEDRPPCSFCREIVPWNMNATSF